MGEERRADGRRGTAGGWQPSTMDDNGDMESSVVNGYHDTLSLQQHLFNVHSAFADAQRTACRSLLSSSLSNSRCRRDGQRTGSAV